MYVSFHIYFIFAVKSSLDEWNRGGSHKLSINYNFNNGVIS